MDKGTTLRRKEEKRKSMEQYSGRIIEYGQRTSVRKMIERESGTKIYLRGAVYAFRNQFETLLYTNNIPPTYLELPPHVFSLRMQGILGLMETDDLSQFRDEVRDWLQNTRNIIASIRNQLRYVNSNIAFMESLESEGEYTMEGAESELAFGYRKDALLGLKRFLVTQIEYLELVRADIIRVLRAFPPFITTPGYIPEAANKV
jgi:hypothetical protein